ncbi:MULTISPECIES: TetR family transcriptional regulator [Rhizobium]|jgi:AcrR family transcriptional regulator|uniref:AcrR family transcriptional regulator n=1 Tax=Rhizobium rhizoryzae TaxID=451876 RepID=A0A7W6LHQ5_9HYPH|nr:MULTISPECIES: TetR family transcriptional regulator [Rhizobium]MBB4143216.1 AcrR family transcriptional regulator [Rhizobium rhizoryzae]
MDATGNQMADRRDVGSHFALRRIPKQERSRERIDEILKVAMDLIGQKGIDAVTMKEIASLSGGPIASVYQYFPNKTAIIATLYERYISQLRSILAGALPQINEAGGIADAAEEMITLYAKFVRSHPHVQDLINAVQADKLLEDIDIKEARQIADMFCKASEAFVPANLREEFVRTAFVMCHLTVSMVRLAIKVADDEGDQIVSDFKASIRHQLSRFVSK